MEIDKYETNRNKGYRVLSDLNIVANKQNNIQHETKIANKNVARKLFKYTFRGGTGNKMDLMKI